jgi:hypothetical protein
MGSQASREITVYFPSKPTDAKEVRCFLCFAEKPTRQRCATYSLDPNGKLDGTFTEYYPNGRVSAISHYAHGRLHGDKVDFYASVDRPGQTPQQCKRYVRCHDESGEEISTRTDF